MTEIAHFNLTVDFSVWQGKAVRLFCWLGWRAPALYFSRLLVDRMIHDQHGGPP